MSWFYDTFLPSLLERAGTNNPMWLSAKQTNICVERMERHTTRYEAGQGSVYSHNYYTLDWRGRKVDLNYSKKNGCGAITFGFTKEEAEASATAYALEKKLLEEERRKETIAWMAWAKENAPDKFTRRMEHMQSKADKYNRLLKENEEDLADSIEYNDGQDVIDRINAREVELKEKLRDIKELITACA